MNRRPLAQVECHLQCVQAQVLAALVAHRPANDPSRERSSSIARCSQPCRWPRPSYLRPRRGRAANREVLLQKIGAGAASLYFAMTAASLRERFYTVLTAQSGNAVTAAADALLLQYLPRLEGAVCLARLHMQGSDLPQQFSVFNSVTALGPAQPVVKAAAGHAQSPAQPGNLELLAMPPNERVLHGVLAQSTRRFF